MAYPSKNTSIFTQSGIRLLRSRAKFTTHVTPFGRLPTPVCESPASPNPYSGITNVDKPAGSPYGIVDGKVQRFFDNALGSAAENEHSEPEPIQKRSTSYAPPSCMLYNGIDSEIGYVPLTDRGFYGPLEEAEDRVREYGGSFTPQERKLALKKAADIALDHYYQEALRFVEGFDISKTRNFKSVKNVTVQQTIECSDECSDLTTHEEIFIDNDVEMDEELYDEDQVLFDDLQVE